MKDPIGAFDEVKDNIIRYVKTAFGTRFQNFLSGSAYDTGNKEADSLSYDRNLQQHRQKDFEYEFRARGYKLSQRRGNKGVARGVLKNI